MFLLEFIVMGLNWVSYGLIDGGTRERVGDAGDSQRGTHTLTIYKPELKFGKLKFFHYFYKNFTMKITKEIQDNRNRLIKVLKSGKYKKGTILSDDKGYPITDGTDGGYCACAVMIHEFPDTDGKESIKNARKALRLTLNDCRYIQQEINDTPLTFLEIADRIEAEIFNHY